MEGIGNTFFKSKASATCSTGIILPKQTHWSTVKVVSSDFLMAIKTADCVHVLLYNPERKVVAAIHAEWRGTAEKIVRKTIQKLIEELC